MLHIISACVLKQVIIEDRVRVQSFSPWFLFMDFLHLNKCIAECCVKVVLQGSPKSPDIHDLSEYHRLYDLGRHLLPPISLTVLTLTQKKYLWDLWRTTLRLSSKDRETSHLTNHMNFTSFAWWDTELISGDLWGPSSYRIMGLWWFKYKCTRQWNSNALQGADKLDLPGVVVLTGQGGIRYDWN